MHRVDEAARTNNKIMRKNSARQWRMNDRLNSAGFAGNEKLVFSGHWMKGEKPEHLEKAMLGKGIHLKFDLRAHTHTHTLIFGLHLQCSGLTLWSVLMGHSWLCLGWIEVCLCKVSSLVVSSLVDFCITDVSALGAVVLFLCIVSLCFFVSRICTAFAISIADLVQGMGICSLFSCFL